ncbi:MAG: kynB2 [Haloplasmataceae bacterium]|jgi:arylformamidase|nr:kynB2 [Haloplasmataceae bacterium]
MKIYDVSMNINENMMVYGNYQAKKPKYIVRADHSNSSHYETSITLDMHSGTHIDAPLHMIKDGQTIEAYKLEDFITPCIVLDLTNVLDRITKADLINKDIHKGDFLLLKTKNSYTNEFSKDFIFVEKSAAEYLVEKGIKGVGTDGLGIERSQPDHETHISLLSKGIIIIEGLRLKDIHEGEYILNALPLKIDNVEASPIRAILIEK